MVLAIYTASSRLHGLGMNKTKTVIKTLKFHQFGQRNFAQFCNDNQKKGPAASIRLSTLPSWISLENASARIFQRSRTKLLKSVPLSPQRNRFSLN